MQRFVSKWSSQCIGTGKNLKRWQMRYEGYCPYCTLPDEDTTHILLCQHNDAVQLWDETFKDFLQQLIKFDTCPILMRAIKYDVTAWRYSGLEQTLDNYPTTIKRCILEQRQLGWQCFFEGIITKTFRSYMTSYYKRKKVHKTSSQRAGRVYKAGWTMIFATWTHHNKQLHETQRIADMEGMQLVRKVIQSKYDRGIGRLPACDFSHLFRNKISILLGKDDDTLKNWLLIIRQGRILLDNQNIEQDDFQTNATLKKWLGLSDRITDKDGAEPLREALQKEIEIGLANLPQRYERYLQNKNILQEPIDKQKNWLITVKKGRKRYDNCNDIHDEFTNPGAFRDWLGL